MPNDLQDNLSNQLIKLGDMMSDGLHHEADGKWINKEYGKVLRALHPEIYQEKRRLKAIKINEAIDRLLLTFICTKCDGKLKQARSGSKVCYCTVCNARYMATSKKK